MSKIWVPRDYQRSIVSFATNTPRASIWASTGSGKTTSGLEWFVQMRMFGEADRLLVISTKRICTMVWPRAIREWSNFQHLSCAVAVGTPAQRLEAIRAGADVTLVNFENLPWLIEVLTGEWLWDTVICDESTRLKSLRIDSRVSSTGKEFLRQSGGSSRAAAIARLAHSKIRNWLNFTGTPCSNGLIDLWGQQWFIDAGKALGRTFSSFEARWFRTVQVGQDAFARRLEPYPHADPEIKALLRPTTITIEAKDFMDLPPLVKNTVPVALSKPAQKAYREMEKAFFVEWKGKEHEAVSAGSKSMKCRQIASGALYVDESLYDADENGVVKRGKTTYDTIHDAKIEALLDIVEEAAGAPVLVGYYFKSSLDRILKAVPKAEYFDDNPRTLERFIRGEIQVLCAHPKSAGHGIDGMQESCNTAVFFDLDWNLEEHEQLIERIGPTRQAQSGHQRAVFIHYLLAEGTLDGEMVERLETKASVQDSVKLAMKRRGL